MLHCWKVLHQLSLIQHNTIIPAYSFIKLVRLILLDFPIFGNSEIKKSIN